MALVGVLSPLQGAALRRARRLWSWFEAEYGSVGVRSYDTPNLSFQAGSCADVERLQAALAAASRTLSPVRLTLDGLRCFEDARTIYLHAIRTKELARLHGALHSILAAHCEGLFDQYRPESWEPHVTVAMGDLTEAAFRDGLRRLAGCHLSLETRLDRIRLVEADDAALHTATLSEWRLLCGLVATDTEGSIAGPEKRSRGR